jgi:hypothetical protein
MSDITKPTNNGAAGFRSIKFAYREDIVDIANDINLQIDDTDIIFNTGKTWNEIYFTPGTLNIDEKKKSDDGGEIIEYTVKLSFPGDTSAATLQFDNMSKRKLLLLIEDQNGNIQLYGTLNYLFSMTYEKMKGPNAGDAKHYTVTLIGTLVKPALYVNQTSQSA